MNQNENITLPAGCKLICLPKSLDMRGKLAFGEGGRHLPFDIKRVFWTYDITDNNVRGDHAHRTSCQILFPIGGSFCVDLDDGMQVATLRMDDPSVGILIPPLVWSRQYGFTKHAACVCLASDFYDAADYIHSYEEFKQLVSK